MRKKKITQDICTSFIYFIFIQNKRKILWKDFGVYGWYVMFYINIYEDENHVIYALAIFSRYVRTILGTHYSSIGFYSNNIT